MRYSDIIFESKANIINLGFPRVIAGLFYRNFGKHAYLFAKWFKDYHQGSAENPNWFRIMFSSFTQKPSDWDLIQLYNSTNSIENYLLARRSIGLYVDPDEIHDEEYLRDQKEFLFDTINEKFFGKNSMFEYYSILKDIISGKLTDLNRYKNLKFMDAQRLYDQYRIFEDTEPIKVYKNGLKWIDVGPRCPFVGHLMSNCGSAGVMSDDPNKTILVLFDHLNIPRVLVTYSPNEGRISGDEGRAGSAVKPIYHPYILDLIKTLGVTLSDTSKSRLLFLKYQLMGRAKNFVQLSKKDDFDTIVKFTIDGTEYYTDTRNAIPRSDLIKLIDLIKTNKFDASNITHLKKQNLTVTQLIKAVLQGRNVYQMKDLGITPVPVSRL